MEFYQGEDIRIRIKGDELIDFVGSDFYAVVYSADNVTDSIMLEKGDFEQVGISNVYDCLIEHSKTKCMIGPYNLEILIEDSEGYRSIYKKENIFEVLFSVIKDK